MENKNTIYNDDVERIVNDPGRQEAINAFHEKRIARRQRKMLMDGIIFAVLCLPLGVLYWTGLVSVWVTAPLQVACSLYSAFRFGRWFENGKCWGWR